MNLFIFINIEKNDYKHFNERNRKEYILNNNRHS